jgi:predicted XRE-type DNA-binding protein
MTTSKSLKEETSQTFASVWDALADTPEEAANLRVRSELMDKITALIEESGWTQTEAAQHCSVTQPRISDLLRGRISRFSLDALVNIASKLGKHVHVELEAA